MFPKLERTFRSYSLSTASPKTNSAHYAKKIVNKLRHEKRSIIFEQPEDPVEQNYKYLIILVRDNDLFCKSLFELPQYVQFIKSKAFMQEQQIQHLQQIIADKFKGQMNDSYTFHVCNFTEGNHSVCLETEETRHVYEMLFEFADNMNEVYNFIFGLDLQLLHKTKFKQVLILSQIRLDNKLEVDLLKHEHKRFRTRQASPVMEFEPKAKSKAQVKTMHSDEDMNGLLKIKKSEMVQNTPTKPIIELEYICNKIYKRFLLIFRIDNIDIDLELFSQFLILVELTIQFSKNKILQQNIQPLNQLQKITILLNKILYFDYKVLKSMNQKLQAYDYVIQQSLIRFITNDRMKFYWEDFCRFKRIYIDQKWTGEDCRMFLLIVTEQNQSYLQQYLPSPRRQIIQQSSEESAFLIQKLLKY